MALKESKILERYFDRIAPNYQKMNTYMSGGLDRYWRKRLLESIQIQPEESILDVACGTCDILSMLKKHFPQNPVVGLDLSFGMLKEAHLKDPKRLLVRANGVETPFDDQSFQCITIAFGFRNMPSLQGFLEEALRLLKPGGQLRILELTRPENPIMDWGNTLYQKTVLPALSSLFGRDKEAYDYLAASIAAFPPQKEIQKMMEKAGFCSSRYVPLNFGVTTLFEGARAQ